MLVSDYNYNLPEENIAKHPPKVRGTTRLLVLDRDTGNITDSHYADLADFLEPGDLVILNDTRVMRARVFAELPGGYKRELVVLEKHKDDLNSVMYHGKLRAGDILTILTTRNGEKTTDTVTIREILGNGTATVSSSRPLADIVEQYGTVPLPPYLRRDANPDDIKRYQTVWAKELGSAAAPTASLNMTEELISKLKTKGVNIEYLTLHVGLGTFLPIRSDKVEEHHMHSEWFHITEQTIKAIEKTKKANHKVIAVGTTVTRTLEFWAKSGKTEGEDDIFIYPGFKFQVVDALLTNFHAPKSTVLMLASAFTGWDKLKPAYDHAIESGYQLLSYGDSMLIK
jgi:S-adenosylmethionine:tRNA ribosyltransferase-isomerase